MFLVLWPLAIERSGYLLTTACRSVLFHTGQFTAHAWHDDSRNIQYNAYVY